MFEYTKDYVPLARDAGYYQILHNGKFFESADIDEIDSRLRELNNATERSL